MSNLGVHTELHGNNEHESLLHYRLPSLLLATDILVLNQPERVITLLRPFAGPQTPILSASQLAPGAMQALELLIQFVPGWCPYMVLIERLVGNHAVPAVTSTVRDAKEWKAIVRPIRRAMRDVHTALEPFNLGVAVLPKVGYQLVQRSELSSYLSPFPSKPLEAAFPPSPLLVYRPESLLPQDYTLVLAPKCALLTLLHFSPEGEARIHFQRQLQPKTVSVLKLLLDVSPQCRSYADLLAALTKQSLDACVQQLQRASQDRQAWKTLMTPLWRAVANLQDSIHQLGFDIISQVGRGYRLVH